LKNYKRFVALMVASMVMMGLVWVGSIAALAEKQITIEASFFLGGYGSEFYKAVVQDYEKANPNVKVNDWYDPRNEEKLRPRFIAGNPPDVVAITHPTTNMLMVEGKIYSLKEALNSPAYGEPKMLWKDTFYPDAFREWTLEGEIYAVPLDFNVNALWYDQRMFNKYGWGIPKNWIELITLCEMIEAQGIAPFAFQGRYPGYANQMWIPLVYREGGMKAVNDLNNLVPGAWLNPAVIEATRKLQKLATNYFQKGCMGMSHIEAQMEFAQGHAAMVACGTYLEGEMKDAWPEGFELSCFPMPVAGGKGEDPNAIKAYCADPHFVPIEAAHPEIAVDFLKFLFSRENAQRFMDMTQGIFAVKAPLTNLSRGTKAALNMAERAKRLINDYLWSYSALGTENAEFTRLMVTGGATPEELCKRMEEVAKKVREDPNIIKRIFGS